MDGGILLGHPWAFPMVLVVVVVVVLEVERWSGPVNEFGCTRSISRGRLYSFCKYFNCAGNSVKNKCKRKGGQFI